MYSYTFDAETGGIILNSTPTNFSKEPRPVYAQEMDILGFDKYWNYEKQNDVPYMWAEANAYWYRGTQVAKTKGGDLYSAPELQPIRDESGAIVFGADSGHQLIPIDLDKMCAINEDLLTVIEDATVKRIVKEYEKFKDRLDIFHVAFSGGKDSAVLLDLVKKALPRDSFVVIFGDTGMEFPDTYEAVKIAKSECEADGTPFYVARSHFDPKESWDLFGPPSRILRWCCSVHKSTPQTLKMREITGKNDYTGLDFVGVRKHESLARSTYEYENYGKKQKGQHSYNPLLEWTSAEIWLYIFARHIFINCAYKKGNSRAGCLLCPMSGGSSDYIRRRNYPDEIDGFNKIIKQKNNWDSYSETELHSYITSGGWDNRRSGRGIAGNVAKYKEKTIDGVITIEIADEQENWREWLKTVDTSLVPLQISEGSSGFVFQMAEKDVKAHGQQSKENAKKAKDVLERDWKDRIHDGQFIVFSYANPDGEKATGAAAVHTILQTIVLSRFKHVQDFTKGLTETQLKLTTPKPVAKYGMGVTEIKGLISGCEKSVLGKVWSKKEYWKDESLAGEHIVIIKKAVDKMIEDAFMSSGRISIGEIYDLLETTFGFSVCNLSAFITGFLLKEYSSEPYRSMDAEGHRDSMTPDKLSEMIGNYIGKAPKATYIVSLTEEEKAFYELTESGCVIQLSTSWVFLMLNMRERICPRLGSEV